MGVHVHIIVLFTEVFQKKKSAQDFPHVFVAVKMKKPFPGGTKKFLSGRASAYVWLPRGNVSRLSDQDSLVGFCARPLRPLRTDSGKNSETGIP